MKHAVSLALFLAAFSPNILFAGDFSNPVPYSFTDTGTNQSGSDTLVPIATAEALRISRMNIGTPNTVVNNYVVNNDQCINCVGDNNSNITVTQDGTNACINVTNNILNTQDQNAGAQSCGEADQ
jgi:hypothetical protein